MSHAALESGSEYAGLLGAMTELLERGRYTAARAVNTTMTATYWEIGRLMVEFEQGGSSRAGYGDRLLDRLATDLTHRFGRGFSRRNLAQMRQFYLAWPIVQTVSAQSPDLDAKPLRRPFGLPWSHYVRRLAVREPPARAFYEAEALRDGRSVRQLGRQIATLFYERTLLARDKAAMLTTGTAPRPEDGLIRELGVQV